jgi:hypothetical protein
MSEKSQASLQPVLISVDRLVSLPNNPRKGNVEAIMASYDRFGQLKPIVVKPNGDDFFTVLAGNHQLEAAKRLGWKNLAAVIFETDDSTAVAFALTDNRVNELGHTDNQLLFEHLENVLDDYSDLFESLGWDEYELASIDVNIGRIDAYADTGYTPPVLTPIDFGKPPSDRGFNVESTDKGNQIVSSGQVDDKTLVTTGATSIGQTGNRNAIVQYTLVFDNVDQQTKWYQFVRWLRSEPSLDGATTAEKIMSFIDAHANY